MNKHFKDINFIFLLCCCCCWLLGWLFFVVAGAELKASPYTKQAFFHWAKVPFSSPGFPSYPFGISPCTLYFVYGNHWLNFCLYNFIFSEMLYIWIHAIYLFNLINLFTSLFTYLLIHTLRTEPRVLHMLGKYSRNELQPLFIILSLEDKST